MKIVVAGDSALIIYFAEEVSAAVSSQVQRAVVSIRAELAEVLVDLVPSYASLLVIYDARQTDGFFVHRRLREILATQADQATGDQAVALAQQTGKLVTLPVYYDVAVGPELELIASNAGLSVAEVIALHQQQEYRVYAIGFAPGFAYLGEVDQRIATPRLATPRPKVPRGAVGIADRQTAVYPAPSPGGWNLIGLCPVNMFDAATDPVMPVEVGDRVRFKAIDQATFVELGGVLP